jgi:hypothetical protein
LDLNKPSLHALTLLAFKEAFVIVTLLLDLLGVPVRSAVVEVFAFSLLSLGLELLTRE